VSPRERAANNARRRLHEAEAYVDYLQRCLQAAEQSVAHHEHELSRLEQLVRR
jgi:hypothetical protein